MIIQEEFTESPRNKILMMKIYMIPQLVWVVYRSSCRRCFREFNLQDKPGSRKVYQVVCSLPSIGTIDWGVRVGRTRHEPVHRIVTAYRWVSSCNGWLWIDSWDFWGTSHFLFGRRRGCPDSRGTIRTLMGGEDLLSISGPQLHPTITNRITNAQQDHWLNTL